MAVVSPYALRFLTKAKAKGFKVSRTRLSRPDINGVYQPASTVVYDCIEDEVREIKYRQVGMSGTDNQKNDGFRGILFPYNADVQEGDELTIANVAWTYQVSSADNPFQVGSDVVYWIVEATRKKK